MFAKEEPDMTIKGSCHCKATTFEVNRAPENVTQCTCSFCSKRGALWAYYTPAQFRLTSPPENVATYLWGSRTVKHHFCAGCGCGHEAGGHELECEFHRKGSPAERFSRARREYKFCRANP